MIPLRSLGYRTELLVNGFENRIEDRGEYVFVQTPTNPGFFWGNLLIFRRPPTSRDITEWPEIFEREFAHEPRVRHRTFAWDSPEAEKGEAQAFVDQGYKWEHSVVITATRVHAPPKSNPNAKVRPLESDEDWEDATRLQLQARPAYLTAGPYENFKRRQFQRYRRMSEAGHGHWYGAFLDGTQVANCGIYTDEQGLGRYQSVITDENHRRQGLAGTLVHKAGQHALDTKAKRLVMIADEHDHPVRIYKSCGFEQTERMIGVFRVPPEDAVHSIRK
jgi:GNAT superfamily N-acetyltransferase